MQAQKSLILLGRRLLPDCKSEDLLLHQCAFQTSGVRSNARIRVLLYKSWETYVVRQKFRAVHSFISTFAFIISFISHFSFAYAQQPQRSRFDSIQHVDEVVVTSRYNHKEVIPSQTLTGEQLEKLSSNSVADALRYFSGIQLKDYGGVGGIKTVNIRSMGTNHLGISYDGVELGNAQNGQIDLGQFSLDNVEEITLFNGQKSAILQPASDFGHAGAIYIRTRAPRFKPGKNYNLKFKTKYGSSDLFRFATLWEQRLSQRLSSSLSAEVLTSSGKYKFRYKRKKQDGTVAYDTTATRQNGDIWAVRAEGNLHGMINDGFWKLKVYTYHSERGIPGAIVNNVWRRGERQWDHNTFLQGRFQKSVDECVLQYPLCEQRPDADAGGQYLQATGAVFLNVERL